MAAAEDYEYQTGFGNEFATEALPDALPKGQNTPQVCPYGLYAEQVNGTAFTRPRVLNKRSWLYRILPSAKHEAFQDVELPAMTAGFVKTNPNQCRWAPFEIQDGTFVEGMVKIAGAGDATLRTGVAIYVYSGSANMPDSAYCSADGDMLIVPQQGTLDIRTEMGRMKVAPGEIVVIPQMIRFSVDFVEGASRGYICEVYGHHFEIPDLGPIGSNGLANPRDFLHPVAWYENRKCAFQVFQKFQDEMYVAEQDHSPFDVVAWHGNYTPFKYDLSNFNTVNSVSFDHLDPCTFTVITAQSAEAGTALLDFVIFPPRWAVQNNTFRPPYYHRNCMSELMGLIFGEYEAKKDGFLPGGATLHNVGTPHGPDTKTFEGASVAPLEPERIAEGTMAFMFESSFVFKITEYAKERLAEDYNGVWRGLKTYFDPENINAGPGKSEPTSE